MHDTSKDIEERMFRMMAQKTPVERLRMASSMFDSGKRLMAAGLRKEYGPLTEAQLRARIFMRMYRQDYSDAEIEKIMKHLPDMEWEDKS